MKTVNDIKGKAILLDDLITDYKDSQTKTLYELYEGVPEIIQVTKDLDNASNGEYLFDESGDFIYQVRIPDHVADLPYINDFYTDFIDSGYFISKFHRGHKDIYLAQMIGQPITICFQHDRSQWAIYDHDSQKGILDHYNPARMSFEYVAACIEAYQQRNDQFHDVVEVDCYGSYLRHFKSPEGIQENYESIIKEFNDKNREVENE